MSKNGKEEERPHISNTQLDMLSKCGEQYRRRYVLGEKNPPGVALIVGKGVDQSVNANLNSKIATGSLLTAEQVLDTARDSVVSEWRGGIRLTNDEVAEGAKKVQAAAIDKAVRLADVHYHQTAPILNPTHVQRPWKIELEGYGVDLIGYIDVQEGVVTVRDTKTSAKSPPAACADESDQLTMYHMAVRVLDEKAPIQVALDYLVDNKTPTAKSYYSKRTDDDILVLLRRLETHLVALEKGVFVPARESDWWCSRKFCGFWESCPYTRKPVTIAGFNPF